MLEKNKNSENHFQQKITIDDSQTRNTPQLSPLRSWLTECSPYLSKIILQNPNLVSRLETQNAEDVFQSLLQDFENPAQQQDTMAQLRHFKQRCHLVIAYADVQGSWQQEQVLFYLSRCADACIQRALRFVWQRSADSYSIAYEKSGLFILAMGKLGGFELNYSSDVDLVIFYDPSVFARIKQIPDPTAFIQKIIRHFVELMTRQTQDGYVWRIDFRLRPDHGTYAAAISLPAAEGYYEHYAQNWERAAFIKARHVAGDKRTAQKFLQYLKPFIWRKHLDFTAINDMRALKIIMQKKSAIDDNILALDIKRGKGCIRDIEFFVQNFQLLWGGRIPDLQTPSTLKALQKLHKHKKITATTYNKLKEAYLFFRQLEHRLQMRLDQQTHSLPRDRQNIEALAQFMGMQTTAQLQDNIQKHRRYVEYVYQTTFEKQKNDNQQEEHSFALRHMMMNPDLEQTALNALKQEGFRKPETILPRLRKWLQGQYPATESDNNQNDLRRLLPRILTTFGQQGEPEDAFTAFDQFLAALPIGTQLFGRLQFQTSLLTMLIELMGKAPRLARRLSKRPALIDAMLESDFLTTIPNAKQVEQQLKSRLKNSRDLVDSLDIARRWSKDVKFQLGVHILQNKINAHHATPHYTAIADCLIKTLKPRIEKAFQKTYGQFDNGELAIIAMGKWGSGELLGASDLDMIFIYTNHDLNARSNGSKPLDPPAYYTRLAQRIISAITTETQDGELYVIDVKLRPSGEQGPLACSLEAYAKYQNDSAWDWEHMALTRARVLTASKTFENAITKVITETLTKKRQKDKLIDHLISMRHIIEQENNQNQDIWNMKHRIGGIIDIEFIAQYLQLLHAHRYPDMLATNTLQALHNAEHNNLITSTQHQQLQDALQFWQRLDGIQRLCHKEQQRDPINKGLVTTLTLASQTASLSELYDLSESHARHVAQLFAAIIAPRLPLQPRRLPQ